VNAASLKDIGDFDRAKYRNVKLDEKFKAKVKNFDYVSSKGLQVTQSYHPLDSCHTIPYQFNMCMDGDGYE
jgi:hypothetical protein